MQTIGAAAALALILVCGIAFVAMRPTPVQATLDVQDAKHVRIFDVVRVKFDRDMDTREFKVKLTPARPMRTKAVGRRVLELTPATQWQAAQSYRIDLASVQSADHSSTLKSWRSTFTTQPKVGVVAYKVDGQPAAQPAAVSPHSKIELDFSVPMSQRSTTVVAGGQAVAKSAVSWAKDSRSVQIGLADLRPYQDVQLGVAQGALSQAGDPLSEPGALSVSMLPQEPANNSSGVGPGFKAITPIEVVVENSGAARPQIGLQQADMVYEYISEYSISRMTAIYFNSLPGLIGPVRSCRMVNPYLDWAFRGVTMCSGMSVGTSRYVFGGGGIPLMPVTVNDFDQGNHFFRSGARAAPHNVFTDAGRADRLRHEWNLPPPRFQVDPPHPDQEAGQPADVPFIGLHAVNYGYDAGTRQYLRFDHGAPFIDQGTGNQLGVKNVVVMHVPFHDAGWVEDENGGAHCIWYDMLGDGAAEIYSDGRVIQGQWHMGDGGAQFFQNDRAPWFSDAAGKPIELNSGLTWIHLVGNGQTS